MKKYLLFIALFVLSACSTQQAELPPEISPVLRSSNAYNACLGPDLLGLAKMDANMVSQELDPGSCVGLLGQTFGDERPQQQVLINGGKVACFKKHLIDGTVNNHACSGKVTSLSYLDAAAAREKEFIIDRNPGTCQYLSPVLEHGCRDKKIVDGWFKLLRTKYPQFGVLCSPDPRGYCPPGIPRDVHGNSTKPGIAEFTSNDGSDVFGSNSAAYRNTGTIMTLAWSYCANGRLSSEKPGDKVPPPTQRKNFCSREEIRHLVRIMREPENKPAMSCKDIVSPDIGKPRAENYGVGHGDVRQNKPMVILSKKFNRMSLQTSAGKEIGCFKYFGTYGTKQYRLYEGNCSGKNPTQLQDLLGGEWGKLVSGNTCYNYNPIRRLGSYR